VPYPTRTGEILLAEEAGDRIRYLTPLRFSSAPPLSASVPSGTPGLAAGEALWSGSAVGTFTDYRGRAVLAAVRRLPGPGWALVVKMDREEVLRGFRTDLLRASFFVALLLALLASALGGYRRRILAQEAVRERDALLRHQAALDRMNRFYRTLSRVNETLVHAIEPEGLLHDVCRVLVETGGFSLAWIGEAEEGGRVTVRASAGEAVGYLDGIVVRCNGSPAGMGPTGRALREGRPVVVNDWETSPSVEPWRERGLKAGFRSSGAFPIRKEGRIWGTLNLYAPVREAFGEEEVALCQELADDLVFAMRSLEDRLHLKETLARLSEAKKLETIGMIAGGVAHEVRNPLFAISTVLAGLERKLGKGGEYDEFFHHLNEQVKRLKELMDDLLSLGRPIETKEFQKVDGGALLGRAVADLAAAYPGAAERVVLPPCGDGPFLWGGEAKLLQVFQNLLSNALFFTPEGGKVRVETHREGDLVRFDVRDKGPGIAPALLENLFTPFASKRKGGTGLGLAIVKKIVEAHGGSVEARNNDPPPGATFTVRLPAHPPRDAAGGEPRFRDGFGFAGIEKPCRIV
jgi:signal transduction histidine kinase